MGNLMKDYDVWFKDEDLAYEEEILRNPYSVKHWLRYVEHKSGSPSEQNLVYERALKELPGSYKLWHAYVKSRLDQVKGLCPLDLVFEDTNNMFERALVTMHKMPRIWIEYCKFLVSQGKVTRTRKTFDRALRALPVTQHTRLWPLYLEFVRKHGVAETAVRVYRRYLQASSVSCFMAPEDAEDYIDFLISIDWLEEAAQRLASVVNDERFVSKHGKSNHQLWNELCELISQNPDKITTLDVDGIIRGGLRRYTDQLGHLWNSLADYYIRSGLFERARDIYEEAIKTVTTVRDFSQVFDAYAQFEELALSKRMDEAAKKAEPSQEDDADIDLRMARFEALMDRRPLLLNSVLLRQNPHNVHEWLKRVALLEDKPTEVIETFMDAVQTVDPKQAVGKVQNLWIEFAKFYEKHEQLEDARVVFEKAVLVPFVKVEDLANVWCEFAEMEIRHENYQAALRLMQRATTPPSRKTAYYDERETVQNRVYKSLRVWSLYADLEESFGTFKTCKSCYDRILDLRIATPQIVINYAMFLEENNYFEEAFKAYEKGVALFRWPHVYDIWNTYLTKFHRRYGGTKLERARDLFEQCLDGCPAKFAKELYLLYAKLEENYGLARHAMAVYERAEKAVAEEQRFEMYNIHIQKAAEIYGVTKTREIYEASIEALPDAQAREMCLRFADMERKLGEIDRARAIYAHCSQMCDPRITSEFWTTWKEFEMKHGNEDTMREMLRIRRSVQATYNTQVNMMSAQMLASSGTGDARTVSDLAPGATADGMRLLEARAAEKSSSLPPSSSTLQLHAKGGVGQPQTATGESKILFVRGGTDTRDDEVAKGSRVQNPDEIDIDMDEGDDDDEEEGGGEGDEDDGGGEGEGDEVEKTKKNNAKKEIGLEKRAVPSEVFGGLAPNDDEA
ncbi:unnamed protein product [Notodromas monacha]|uniref:Pre-mRNA-splicing factor SYF1 n=1 Tax=Notodromas monacha TaxID=399045 RepID=A0A7R9BXJ9_9CRUS|nr:unnamed protein product [Notodromas monacha]CAG0922078.1 unnamed protein product [Notodromas monacha]